MGISENRFVGCENIKDLRCSLQEFADQIGFNFFSYLLIQNRPGIISTENEIFITNYDDEWRTRYNERCYKHYDPVALVSKRSRLPFFWNSLGFLRQFPKDQRRVFHEARNFGILSGYSIPISGPGGEVGVFTVASRRSDIMDDIVHDGAGRLFLTGLQAHDCVLKLNEEEGGSSHPNDILSARELECLKWTAEGLTTDEIGNRICIAPVTVNYHLNKVVKRFGAANRHHAAIIAVRKGII